MPCYFRLRCDANTDAFLMGRLQPLVYFRHADVARQAAVGNSDRIAAGSTRIRARRDSSARWRYALFRGRLSRLRSMRPLSVPCGGNGTLN